MKSRIHRPILINSEMKDCIKGSSFQVHLLKEIAPPSKSEARRFKAAQFAGACLPKINYFCEMKEEKRL